MSGLNKFREVLSLSCIAIAAVAAYVPIGFDDAAIAADDAPVKGVSLNPAEAGEDYAALILGTIQVKASGVITKGDRVVSAANGGVKKADGASLNDFATALTDAADGNLVNLLRI